MLCDVGGIFGGIFVCWIFGGIFVCCVIVKVCWDGFVWKVFGVVAARVAIVEEGVVCVGVCEGVVMLIEISGGVKIEVVKCGVVCLRVFVV